METRVFIMLPPVRGGPGRINDLAATFAQQVLPNVAIARGMPKKRGGRRVELRPKLFSGLRLGGPRDRPPSAADECRHSCLPGCKETGGTPRSALTISDKQFTINLASRVQLG